MSAKKQRSMIGLKEKSNTYTLVTLVLGMFLFLIPGEIHAQCAMCRAVLETSGENSMAEGINDGIVYLMAIPYILVAFLFYFIYRKMRS